MNGFILLPPGRFEEPWTEERRDGSRCARSGSMPCASAAACKAAY